jgi:opacity protein-like surface antigen
VTIRAGRGPLVPASLRLLPVLSILLAAAPIQAQRADFLFGRPNVTLSVSTGWAMPAEGSDLFSEARRNLTVSPGDFGSFLVLVEGAVRVTEQFDAVLGLEHAGSTVRSEMRDWVTQDDRPIPQATNFKRTRLMGSVKWYAFPRGRGVSEYVWVPNAWSPYVGGGVGVTWYDFYQYGDFVDFQTLDIFETRLRSDGRGFTQHVMAGADVSLTARFLVRGEYRYIWGSAPVDQSVFEDFGDIDLSGSRITVGIAVRM